MRALQISYTFLGSFLATVFLLQWPKALSAIEGWQLSYPLSLWLLLAAFASLGSLGLPRTDAKRLVRGSLALTLGSAIAFSAVARTTHTPSPQHIEWYAGQEIIVVGIVREEPERRAVVTPHALDVRAVVTEDGEMPIEGTLVAEDHRGWPEYHYGDEVIVTGTLESPRHPGQEYRIRYAHLSLRSGGHGNRVFTMLARIKQRFEFQINRVFPEPHASLLAGLLLGSRSGIPRHLLEDFNTTGLTHIVAISGYNVTLILALLSRALFWLPLRFRFPPLTLGLVAFTLLVGASASVVRAAIMGFLGLLALQIGRPTHMRLAILWTAFFMLLWKPQQLWWDAGFQLSFLAVIGISELSPLLTPLFARIPETFSIRDALLATIAAQIATLPWVAFLFERISFIAPLANVLIAAALPFAMLFGFLGTCVSFMWFFGGQLIAFWSYGFLHWIISVAEALANLPLASLRTIAPHPFTIILCYALLIAGISTIRTRGPSSPLSSTEPALPAGASSPGSGTRAR